jgi:hypothetical protein
LLSQTQFRKRHVDKILRQLLIEQCRFAAGDDERRSQPVEFAAW